ncbi:hypothetical protein ACSDR0_47760 [Streptosporangium sp. G11]|uniref:hypothetical protein n=1 Tax=Streptosporangium sp. G11 TaxID=3436926 RepID=UPI003EBB0E01
MNTVTRRVAAVVLAAGVVAGTGAVSAPAASAMACDVQIGVTHKSGNYIVGYGSLSGCPSTSIATLSIQRRNGTGGWDTRATGTAHQGYDTYIRYNCSGTGTQTWRTTINGKTIGGSYKFKESNHLRVYCG